MKKKKDIEDLLDIKIDEDKRIVIEMQVLDDSNFLSPYCSNYYIANDEIISYLNNRVKNLNVKAPLRIIINSNVIDENEKKIYTTAIKNYYFSGKKQLVQDLFNNMIVSLVMFAIGLVIIAIMIYMSLHADKEIWTTVFDIVGWVFIWEAVDKFFFERRQLKRDFLRAEQFINADFVYKDKTI